MECKVLDCKVKIFYFDITSPPPKKADIGRIGALISLKASARPEPLPGKLQEFFAQMAMQVAGMNPKCILVSDEALKGLPEAEAAEKALMTQPFLFDQNMTVRQSTTLFFSFQRI